MYPCIHMYSSYCSINAWREIAYKNFQLGFGQVPEVGLPSLRARYYQQVSVMKVIESLILGPRKAVGHHCRAELYVRILPVTKHECAKLQVYSIKNPNPTKCFPHQETPSSDSSKPSVICAIPKIRRTRRYRYLPVLHRRPFSFTQSEVFSPPKPPDMETGQRSWFRGQQLAGHTVSSTVRWTVSHWDLLPWELATATALE